MVDYRTIDGTDNNLAKPTLNSANSDETRIARANFAHGTKDTPVSGPNPRTISNIVSSGPDADNTDPTLSAYMYVWGQFIDHDIDRNPVGTTPLNIPVPAGDPNFSAGSSIAMTRGLVDPANGYAINAVTGWLDGSMIYGSDATTAASLRGPDGTMATSAGDNLPIVNGAYVSGDVRVTENPDLTALTTLFVREHNFQVGLLKAEHPSWSSDQLYQQAKAIVTAEIQNITYSEYLPQLLGPDAIGPYQGYDSHVNPQITEEFSTAAYRFGHSIVSGEEAKLANDGTELASQNLAQAFFDTPDQFAANDGASALLRNLASDPSQANDVYAINDLRNLLAASPDFQDLIAIDIQRERDLGIPTLNQTRAALGLAPYTSFNQITSDPTVAANLQKAYGSVDKLDLFIGGLAENHAPGAMVGPTFQAIIADQFNDLRAGDRFWWQNQGFDSATAQQIASTTLSQIIQRDADTPYIQPDAFLTATRHPSNVASESPEGPQMVMGVAANGATLTGGPAADMLVASSGQGQTLTGGGGGDTFVFSPLGQHDTITDFQPGLDKLEFIVADATKPLPSFASLALHETTNGNTLVQFGRDLITLVGVDQRQLGPNDVLFQYQSPADHLMAMAAQSGSFAHGNPPSGDHQRHWPGDWGHHSTTA